MTRLALYLFGALWLFTHGGMATATPVPPAAAVASAHPLATRAGHEILAAGGNAFDAAVAVSAALAVVEPAGSGLGGGGFWLLHRAADGRQVLLDGRERAPLAAQRDMYLDADGQVVRGRSIDGALAAAIPGVPAALAHLADHYGRLPLADSLQPAIRYARAGFEVDERYRARARFRRAALRASPAAAAVFLLDNAVPPVGHRVRQPELARTLEAIAQDGADGFYGGQVAAALVEGVRASGGIWSMADLRSYRVVEREPLQGRYSDLRVVSAGPPSSAGTALLSMLNILSGYDLRGADREDRNHLIVEAMRRAYRDRAEYLGDPDFVDVPVAELISAPYAARLRRGIDRLNATPSASLPAVAALSPRGRDTTHFSILDRSGNRVAATLSINYPFGSGFMPAGTGVLLNDEMDDFSAKPGVPNAYGLVGAQANAIAPGKRPLSSMAPTFIESPRGVAIIGTPGGSRIISMVLLATLAYAAGADANELVSQARFHHQYMPDVLEYETAAFDEDTLADLTLRGHALQGRPAWGNMQAVVWQRQANRVQAASDPRGLGHAEVRP